MGAASRIGWLLEGHHLLSVHGGQVMADRPVDCVQLFYSDLSRRSMNLTPRESNKVMLK